MLAYRHIYHAGSFADVLKHTVVAAVAAHIAQKPKPFFYLDTHAGAGVYDLRAPEAEKLGEFRDGIVRVLAAGTCPAVMAPYLAVVEAVNPGGGLRYYPGAARVVQHFARPADRMALYELHPRDHAELARQFAGRAGVRVACADGLAGLAAELPPRERRGMVLVDPSYEGTGDYRAVPAALARGYRRFATGIFAVWYPLIGGRAGVMLGALKTLGTERVLRAELHVRAPRAAGLSGCGLIMVNPPWQLDLQLAVLLPWLVACLAPGHGAWRLDWPFARGDAPRPAGSSRRTRL